MFKTKKSRALAAGMFGFLSINILVICLGFFFGVDGVEPGLLASFALIVILWSTIIVVAMLAIILITIFSWIEKGKENE